jgi:hypothetical protein
MSRSTGAVARSTSPSTSSSVVSVREWRAVMRNGSSSPLSQRWCGGAGAASGTVSPGVGSQVHGIRHGGERVGHGGERVGRDPAARVRGGDLDSQIDVSRAIGRQ